MKFYHTISVISLFLYYINIQGQTEMTTEKFDIEAFENNKVNGEYNFTLDNGTKVRQVSSNIDYGEYITPPTPKLFIISKQYYKTGELQCKIVMFPNRFLKAKKIYDRKGNLIKEINYDKPYKFTFEQLVELLKKEEDPIDLYDKNTSIVRGVDEKGAEWVVTYKKTWGRREVIKINGVTGKITQRSHHPHVDN